MAYIDKVKVNGSTYDINNLGADTLVSDISKAAQITSGSDYDDITTPGNYYAGATIAATLTHCPTTSGHRLFVFKTVNNSNLAQVVLDTNNRLFIRTYTASAWRVWKNFVDVDGTVAATNAVASSIPGNTDYNDLTALGRYYVTDSSTLPTMTNCPTGYNHIMFVINGNTTSNYFQLLLDNIGRIFVRRYSSDLLAWREWSRITTADELEDIETEISGLNNRVTALEKAGQALPPIIYCWGDSLTEGVGGFTLFPPNLDAYVTYSYPQWVGMTYSAVNLGSRNEDVNAIMARQGADPIKLASSLSIPASKDTPVRIVQMSKMYNKSSGTGLTSANGNLLKMNIEVESAGLNPCTISGVEGIIYRELTNTTSDDETYNIMFKRLKDGSAVTAPSGTIVQSYAMRFYRNNGAAVIWMGANGNAGSATEFCAKIDSMIAYGGYGNNYLVIVSHEFSGSDLEIIKEVMTDGNGVCHVVSLVDELPYRGLMMAGVGRINVDTTGWETPDPIKKAAPVLYYFNGNPSLSLEEQYDNTHFSAWGYKAIGKLVVERLGEIGMTGGTPAASGDTYGSYRYKLKSARTLTGNAYLDTHVNLYEKTTDKWTVVIKWHGTPTAVIPMAQGGVPTILSATKDEDYAGLVFRYPATTEYANVLVGKEMFSISNNIGDHYTGTNILIITKNGNNYRVYANSTTPVEKTSSMSSSETHRLPLIAGGRWNKYGTDTNMYTSMVVDDLRIYDGALSDSSCVAIYNDLSN